MGTPRDMVVWMCGWWTVYPQCETWEEVAFEKWLDVDVARRLLVVVWSLRSLVRRFFLRLLPCRPLPPALI